MSEFTIHLVRDEGRVEPSFINASIMQRVEFICRSWHDVEWKLNGQDLPTKGITLEFKESSKLHILTVVIQSLSYFGHYSCLGIDYALETGFYDYAKLSHTGKLVECMI